jgi:hypothetical protein
MRKRPILFAVPLLLGAAPPFAVPDACESMRGKDIHIAPIPIVDIARNPVPLVDHASVAHEVAQIATRGWLLGTEIRVPGPERLVYPAGTPLDRGFCLPDAHPPFVAAPGDRRPRVGSYVQACLADRDGDGVHEGLDVFAGNSAMHVPTRDLDRSETLAAPQRLVEDPLGHAASRRYVHREVTVYVEGPVAEGLVARFRIAHALQDQTRYDPPGAYVAGPGDSLVYRLTPRPPWPVSMTGNGYYAGANDPEVTIAIADGAEVEVGGLRFRIDHYAHGWTIEPLADRFPPWIRTGCGGTRLILGHAPQTPMDSAPAPR